LDKPTFRAGGVVQQCRCSQKNNPPKISTTKYDQPRTVTRPNTTGTNSDQFWHRKLNVSADPLDLSSPVDTIALRAQSMVKDAGAVSKLSLTAQGFYKDATINI
jgi:hypothetical protein